MQREAGLLELARVQYCTVDVFREPLQGARIRGAITRGCRIWAERLAARVES